MDSGSLAGMTALFCVPGNPRYRGCRQPALPWLPATRDTMATANPNPAVIPQSRQRYPESTRSADQPTGF